MLPHKAEYCHLKETNQSSNQWVCYNKLNHNWSSPNATILKEASFKKRSFKGSKLATETRVDLMYPVLKNM